MHEVEKHLGLAIKVARSFPNIEFDDALWGVCMPCIDRCLKTHDPSRGAFSTYAVRAMRNALLGYLKRQVRFPYRIPEQFDIADERIILAEIKMDAYTLLSCLSKRLKLVILMRFWKGMTHQEIGDKFGVSKTCITYWLNEAYEKCRVVDDLPKDMKDNVTADLKS